MKLAVLSDIHANYPALNSVVNDVDDKVDGYVYAGDYIGILGYPSEVVSFVMNNHEMAVKGNHDISVIENNKGHVNSSELSQFELDITKDNLNNSQQDWVSNLNTYEENEELGILMSHAKPTPELSSGLKPRSALNKGSFPKYASKINTDIFNYIIVGHSHNQEALNVSKFGHDVIVLNPGSVGGPNQLGVANYAIIDTQKLEYSLHQSEYDKKIVEDHLDELKVPQKWW